MNDSEIRIAKLAVARAKAKLEAREKDLKEARAAFARANPLTDEQLAALLAYMAAGGNLCCESGLAWLRAALPLPWAEAINGWAYGRLGCGPKHQPGGGWYDDDVKKVKELARETFPPEGL